MFKFGEFDSAEELNKAAEGFKNEGDLESLYALAEENGISKEDAEDYADGYVDQLASDTMAAYGRLEVEKKKLKECTDVMQNCMTRYILLFIEGMLLETSMQKAIMKKGKSPSDLIKYMRDAAKKHANGNMGVCCGTDKELKDLIRVYYTGSEDELQKKLDSLYK